MTNERPYLALKSPLPDDWELFVGVDTGTYMSAAFVGIPPGDVPTAVVLAEFPNYRYVSHELELLGYSTPEWAKQVVAAFHYFRPRTEVCQAWADPNTQFRAELLHYGLHLRPNAKGPELRVEITREYFAANPPRIHLMPWLRILPYELEFAKWPDEATSAGKYMRLKKHDHTLDCVEHCLSRRPQPNASRASRKKSFLEQQLEQHRRHDIEYHHDPHLGSL